MKQIERSVTGGWRPPTAKRFSPARAAGDFPSVMLGASIAHVLSALRVAHDATGREMARYSLRGLEKGGFTFPGVTSSAALTVAAKAIGCECGIETIPDLLPN
jgi:hypothetical protein